MTVSTHTLRSKIAPEATTSIATKSPEAIVLMRRFARRDLLGGRRCTLELQGIASRRVHGCNTCHRDDICGDPVVLMTSLFVDIIDHTFSCPKMPQRVSNISTHTTVVPTGATPLALHGEGAQVLQMKRLSQDETTTSKKTQWCVRLWAPPWISTMVATMAAIIAGRACVCSDSIS